MKTFFKLACAAALSALFSCSSPSTPGFVQVSDGQFVRDGHEYRFVGANFWYGPILASEGRGGNIDRLARELDTLKALGLENLRVLVGGDGEDGLSYRIGPALQTAPGVYNDTLLVGLDRFLVELGKREMTAVLYLNNTWEWSGGYGQYLEWASGEKALFPLIDGYEPFTRQMSKFQTSTGAQKLFFDHVRSIVGRTNSITGRPYKDDPAIFSWQIGNEPRCFSSDPAVRSGFIGWLTEAARLIKEIDPNHMVSTGSEGFNGCEQDTLLLEQLCSIPGIDYMTVHIWPYNWSWVRAESLEEDLGPAIDSTDAYLARHYALAGRLGQPLVIEEFGFPRDGFSESREASTSCRDKYYAHMLSLLRAGKVSGLNFWGWSGFAEPEHLWWEEGDDYTGDPAQETQGLNGVYVTDSTVKLFVAY